MFGQLNAWRRIATLYDRCAKTFLSDVALAATVMLWPWLQLCLDRSWWTEVLKVGFGRRAKPAPRAVRCPSGTSRDTKESKSF